MLVLQLVDHAVPAAAVGKRAVHQNDGFIIRQRGAAGGGQQQAHRNGMDRDFFHGYASAINIGGAGQGVVPPGGGNTKRAGARFIGFGLQFCLQIRQRRRTAAVGNGANLLLSLRLVNFLGGESGRGHCGSEGQDSNQ